MKLAIAHQPQTPASDKRRNPCQNCVREFYVCLSENWTTTDQKINISSYAMHV